MPQFPLKLTNVSVFPYFIWPKDGGIGPVMMPLLTGGEGEYEIKILGGNFYYNAEVWGGKLHPDAGRIVLHGKYIITGIDKDNKRVDLPWEFCTEAGNDKFNFGRTISLGKQANSSDTDAGTEPLTLSVPRYGILGSLTDINASIFGDLDPLVIPLIENGKGNVIYTKVGTPHLMGIRVDSGTIVNKLRQGMSNITISGKTADGKLYSVTHQMCYTTEFPVIFFSKWF